MRCAWEQVHGLHFLDAVPKPLPFLNRIGNFIRTAEDVQHPHRMAGRQAANHARFRSLAGRVQQNALGLFGNWPREPHLQKFLIDFSGDETVVLLQELRAVLRAFNARAFPFHAKHRLGRFPEGETEEPVTAVQIQELVRLLEPQHAASRLDEVVDLALVNLAETGGRIFEAEVPQVEGEFPRAKELLEAKAFGGALGFQIVVAFRLVQIGVGRRHMVGALLQNFCDGFQFADDACVQLLHIENHHAILVGPADDNPV